ncbi:hypothetical protein H0H93_008442 [Arthromyces matolae]|nr:hypothetical protein H0H93_008442 [Arthromyces matolae]
MVKNPYMETWPFFARPISYLPMAIVTLATIIMLYLGTIASKWGNFPIYIAGCVEASSKRRPILPYSSGDHCYPLFWHITAMVHPCLEIGEIIGPICEAVYLSRDGTLDHLKHLNRISKVNKKFRDWAISIMWTDLESPLPLLMSLPKDLIKVLVGPTRTPTLVLTREPTKEEVEQFLTRSQRVRILTLPGRRKPSKGMSTKRAQPEYISVAPQVYTSLSNATLALSQTMFPKMLSLTIVGGYPEFEPILCHLPPTLSEIQLLYDKYHPGSSEGYERLGRYIARHHGRLRSLATFTHMPFRVANELACSLDQLRHLTINCVKLQTFYHIASLHTLQSLEMRFRDADLKLVDERSFPSLKYLVVSCDCLSVAIGLIPKLTCPPLTKLKIKTNTPPPVIIPQYPGGPGIRDPIQVATQKGLWRQLFKVIGAQRSWWLESLEILENPCIERGTLLTFDALKPLLVLKSLRRLKVVTADGIIVQNEDYDVLFDCLPGLEGAKIASPPKVEPIYCVYMPHKLFKFVADEADRKLSTEEQNGLIKAVQSPETVLSTGVRAGGQKFFVIQAQSGSRSIYGKKQADGIVIVKTTQAILVAEYNAPLQAAETTPIVENLADYLLLRKQLSKRIYGQDPEGTRKKLLKELSMYKPVFSTALNHPKFNIWSTPKWAHDEAQVLLDDMAQTLKIPKSEPVESTLPEASPSTQYLTHLSLILSSPVTTETFVARFDSLIGRISAHTYLTTGALFLWGVGYPTDDTDRRNNGTPMSISSTQSTPRPIKVLMESPVIPPLSLNPNHERSDSMPPGLTFSSRISDPTPLPFSSMLPPTTTFHTNGNGYVNGIRKRSRSPSTDDCFRRPAPSRFSLRMNGATPSRVEELKFDLDGIRQRISMDVAQESALLRELQALGHDIPARETPEESVLRLKLQKVEEELRAETNMRMEAEAALMDIKRECNDPFIIPALYEAAEAVSRLTTRVLQAVHDDTASALA